MPIDPDTRWYFLHVMKTAGTTFRGHIDNNFAPELVLPQPGVDEAMFAAKADIRYLRSGNSGPGFLCSANDHLPCAWGAVKAVSALWAWASSVSRVSAPQTVPARLR